MTDSHEERLRRARISLEGLSVGDAFGDQFFKNGAANLLESRTLPNLPWRYTDDTNMALSIYENLRLYGEIRQDELARSFARHYNPFRGYGPAMHRVLMQIQDGEHWKNVSRTLFSGQGSYGNGAAMRVAPIGAYFADDMELVIKNAYLSADVTHAHPEGIAGAIATAVAVALTWQLKSRNEKVSRQDFIDLVMPHVPGGFTREKLRHARNLAAGASVNLAVSALGNGSQISAQDTVPLVLWSAGELMSDFVEAMWQTADASGDIDTNCAIVGGIVALYTGIESIPAEWLQAREPLPEWAFT
jgi:ADP-ribosylglycohydrolase